MEGLEDHITEYCSSEHFFLLDDALKPQAEDLLTHFCDGTDDGLTNQSILNGLSAVANAALPAEVKRGFPRLLKGYVEYLAATSHVPDPEACTDFIQGAETTYIASIRDDGSVKGETVRNRHTAVGRNEPCPCGSGRKFKKCCGR